MALDFSINARDGRQEGLRRKYPVFSFARKRDPVCYVHVIHYGMSVTTSCKVFNDDADMTLHLFTYTY